MSTSRLRAPWTALAILGFLTLPATGQDFVLRVDGDEGSSNGDGSAWGSSAYKYLQDALTDATVLAESATVAVWVAATDSSNPYRPDRTAASPSGTGSRTSTFVLVSNVSIYGGFRGTDSTDPNNVFYGETSVTQRDPELRETILSGNIGDPNDSTDNCGHVVVASGAEASSMLNGFTVRDGYADLGGGSGNSGGGLFVIGSEARFVRCRETRKFVGFVIRFLRALDAYPRTRVAYVRHPARIRADALIRTGRSTSRTCYVTPGTGRM